MDLDDGFSVVIPHYNSSIALVLTLDSVFNQSLQPFEIIVVDDCSSADEVSKLKDLDAKLNFRLVLNSKNKGPSYCRNIGIEMAGAKNVAFIDSDDVWHPEKLEQLLPVLKDLPFVFHDYSQDAEFSFATNLGYELRKLTIKNFLIRNLAQTSCIALDKTKVCVRFDESMRYCEDFDLCLRYLAREKKEIAYLKGCVMTHLGRPQLSKGGLSGNLIRMRIGEFQAYSKLIDNSMLSPIGKGLLVCVCVGKYIFSLGRKLLRGEGMV